MHIALHYLCQTAPQNHIMPVRTIRHLRTILKRIPLLCRGKTETSHSNTLLYITHLRVCANMAYHHYLIHNCNGFASPK